MKNKVSLLVITSLVFFFGSTFIYNEAHAAKKPKAKTTSLVLKARDGSNIVYGSVLNSKENEIKTKLPSNLLKAIRSAGIDNISITLTKLAEKEGDIETTYTLNSSESVDLFGKFLVINLLASLTGSGGETYTAGALPGGKYELAITAGNTIVKGYVQYKPPTVVVGNVTGERGDCGGGGTNQINNVDGKALSRTVALSNCSYFNEVQAARETSKKTKARILFQTSDTTDTASETNTEDTSEPPIGISTGITAGGEILKAVVELDPEQNGDVQFNLTPETTNNVDTAQALGEGDTGLTTEALREAADPTKIAEEEENIENIGNENEGEDFQFDPSCPEKLIAAIGDVSEKSSNDELLALAKKLIDQIQNGDLGKCLPAFVSKIIAEVQNKGDAGLIAFAKRFIFHITNDITGDQGPDPKEICQHLGEGLKFLKECKGNFCPPPPCFREEMKALLKQGCPELLTLVPDNKCQEGPRACGLGGPPGDGFPGGGVTSGQFPGGGATGGQFPGGPGEFPGGLQGFASGPGFGGLGQPNFGPFPGPGEGSDFGGQSFNGHAQVADNSEDKGCIQFKRPKHPCEPCNETESGQELLPGGQIPNCPGQSFPSGVCKEVLDYDGNPTGNYAVILTSAPVVPFGPNACQADEHFDLNSQCAPAPEVSCEVNQNDGTPENIKNYRKICCEFGGGFGGGFPGPGGFPSPGGFPGNFSGGFPGEDHGGFSGPRFQTADISSAPTEQPTAQLEPQPTDQPSQGQPNFGNHGGNFGNQGGNFGGQGGNFGGQGGSFGGHGRPHQSVYDCIRTKLCAGETIDQNFGKARYSAVNPSAYESIRQACISEANTSNEPQDFGNGNFGQGGQQGQFPKPGDQNFDPSKFGQGGQGGFDPSKFGQGGQGGQQGQFPKPGDQNFDPSKFGQGGQGGFDPSKFGQFGQGQFGQGGQQFGPPPGDGGGGFQPPPSGSGFQPPPPSGSFQPPPSGSFGSFSGPPPGGF